MNMEEGSMDDRDRLRMTVDALVQAGKGILAADESGPTIAKRFKAIGVESTEENRRAYRNLLLATPGLGAFISGVILYEETLVQRADDGTSMPELAARQGIVPGIKVDAGKFALAHAPGDESHRDSMGSPSASVSTKTKVRVSQSGVRSTTSPMRCPAGLPSKPMRTHWPDTPRSARTKVWCRSSSPRC
jgi:Fructose-bisphosphate aldolase class-I